MNEANDIHSSDSTVRDGVQQKINKIKYTMPHMHKKP